jgi:hypothetical protein
MRGDADDHGVSLAAEHESFMTAVKRAALARSTSRRRSSRLQCHAGARDRAV